MSFRSVFKRGTTSLYEIKCKRFPPFSWLKFISSWKYLFLLRPKLKLSLFALYRPTRKYPADSKDFFGKKVLLFFFYLSQPFIVLLFIVYLPRQLQKSCKKLGNQCYFLTVIVFTSQSCLGFINYNRDRPLCQIF